MEEKLRLSTPWFGKNATITSSFLMELDTHPGKFQSQEWMKLLENDDYSNLAYKILDHAWRGGQERILLFVRLLCKHNMTHIAHRMTPNLFNNKFELI